MRRRWRRSERPRTARARTLRRWRGTAALPRRPRASKPSWRSMWPTTTFTTTAPQPTARCGASPKRLGRNSLTLRRRTSARWSGGCTPRAARSCAPPFAAFSSRRRARRASPTGVSTRWRSRQRRLGQVRASAGSSSDLRGARRRTRCSTCSAPNSVRPLRSSLRPGWAAAERWTRPPMSWIRCSATARGGRCKARASAARGARRGRPPAGARSRCSSAGAIRAATGLRVCTPSRLPPLPPSTRSRTLAPSAWLPTWVLARGTGPRSCERRASRWTPPTARRPTAQTSTPGPAHTSLGATSTTAPRGATPRSCLWPPRRPASARARRVPRCCCATRHPTVTWARSP
mmetsp:Transcript_865/g.3379  ORF Transcript_865/g.3379 Transcript_865/m.3379 type:complete len:346 (-) Transcript_865:431-1468(-)